MIKIAVVADQKLFELLKKHYQDFLDKKLTPDVLKTIRLSILAMLNYISADPYEKKYPRDPDFGHPLGHIFEPLSNYHIIHGEAVAIDMAISTFIAYKKDVCLKKTLMKLIKLLIKIGLPIYHPCCEETQKIFNGLKDAIKHRNNQLNMVVPLKIGKAEAINKLSMHEFKEAVSFVRILSDRISINKFLKPKTNSSFPTISLSKPYQLKIELKHFPRCMPNEVIIAVLTSGVCGTDIKTYKGGREFKPGVIGHEGVGIIVKVGKNVKGFREGDRVVINPNYLNPVKVNYFYLGIDGDGLFGHYYKISQDILKEKRIYKAPDSIYDQEAVAIEPSACGMHSINSLIKTINKLEGKSIGVFGAGQSGILLLQLLKVFKARVFLFNRSFPRLKKAIDAKFIKKKCCFVLDEFLKRKVQRLNQRRMLDAVAICTPFVTQAIDTAFEIIKDSGCILLFGGTKEDSIILTDDNKEVSLHNIRQKEKTVVIKKNDKKIILVGTYGINDKDFKDTIKLIAEKKLNVLYFNSHVVSLGAIPELFDKISSGKLQSAKVLVDNRIKSRIILPWEKYVSYYGLTTKGE